MIIIIVWNSEEISYKPKIARLHLRTNDINYLGPFSVFRLRIRKRKRNSPNSLMPGTDSRGFKTAQSEEQLVWGNFLKPLCSPCREWLPGFLQSRGRWTRWDKGVTRRISYTVDSLTVTTSHSLWLRVNLFYIPLGASTPWSREEWIGQRDGLAAEGVWCKPEDTE